METERISSCTTQQTKSARWAGRASDAQAQPQAVSHDGARARKANLLAPGALAE